MKVCLVCKASKDPDQFYRNPLARDGLHSYCKPCLIEYNRNNRQRRPGWRKREALARTMHADGMKCCVSCDRFKLVREFFGRKEASDGLQSYCKPCSYLNTAAVRMGKARAPTP